MNVWFIKTKIFALFFLIFVNFNAAPAQTDSVYQLQAGTQFKVEMDNEISSTVARVNDTFTATLVIPLVKREVIVLPVGTIVEGRVTKVRRPSLGGKGGILEVSFQTIRLANGVKREIEGLLVSRLKTDSAQTANVLKIIGGTVLGGIVGAFSKVSNGVLIGAGIGAGTGAVFLKKGKNPCIKADEEFEIKLTKTVSLPVPDF